MDLETTCNEVWHELLDAARLVMHFSNRHRRNPRTVRFVPMAAATSYVVTLLNLLPEFMQQIDTAAIAILIGWDFFRDLASKDARVDTSCIKCN